MSTTLKQHIENNQQYSAYYEKNRSNNTSGTTTSSDTKTDTKNFFNKLWSSISKTGSVEKNYGNSPAYNEASDILDTGRFVSQMPIMKRFHLGNEYGSGSNNSTFLDGFEDPTHLTFKIEFGMFGASVTDNETVAEIQRNSLSENVYFMDYDRFPMGLLDLNMADMITYGESGTTNLDFNNQQTYNAFNYLLSRNQDRRAQYIREFIEGLYTIQRDFPYIFQKISGLQKLAEFDSQRGQRLKDVTLKLTCIADGIDQKIRTLMEFYRKAAWDDVYQRWVLPDIMRYFRMVIYIFDDRSLQMGNGEFSPDQEQFPIMCYDCSPCEFVVKSGTDEEYTQNYFELKNSDPVLEIKVKNVQTLTANNLFQRVKYIKDIIYREDSYSTNDNESYVTENYGQLLDWRFRWMQRMFMLPDEYTAFYDYTRGASKITHYVGDRNDNSETNMYIHEISVPDNTWHQATVTDHGYVIRNMSDFWNSLGSIVLSNTQLIRDSRQDDRYYFVNDMMRLDYNTFSYYFNNNFIEIDENGVYEALKQRIISLKDELSKFTLVENLWKPTTVTDSSIKDSKNNTEQNFNYIIPNVKKDSEMKNYEITGTEPAVIDTYPEIIINSPVSKQKFKKIIENTEKIKEDFIFIINNLTKPTEEMKGIIENLSKPVQNTLSIILNLSSIKEDMTKMLINVKKPDENMQDMITNLTRTEQKLVDIFQNLEKSANDFIKMNINTDSQKEELMKMILNMDLLKEHINKMIINTVHPEEELQQMIENLKRTTEKFMEIQKNLKLPVEDLLKMQLNTEKYSEDMQKMIMDLKLPEEKLADMIENLSKTEETLIEMNTDETKLPDHELIEQTINTDKESHNFINMTENTEKEVNDMIKMSVSETKQTENLIEMKVDITKQEQEELVKMIPDTSLNENENIIEMNVDVTKEKHDMIEGIVMTDVSHGDIINLQPDTHKNKEELINMSIDTEKQKETLINQITDIHKISEELIKPVIDTEIKHSSAKIPNIIDGQKSKLSDSGISETDSSTKLKKINIIENTSVNHSDLIYPITDEHKQNENMIKQNIDITKPKSEKIVEIDDTSYKQEKEILVEQTIDETKEENSLVKMNIVENPTTEQKIPTMIIDETKTKQKLTEMNPDYHKTNSENIIEMKEEVYPKTKLEASEMTGYTDKGKQDLISMNISDIQKQKMNAPSMKEPVVSEKQKLIKIEDSSSYKSKEPTLIINDNPLNELPENNKLQKMTENEYDKKTLKDSDIPEITGSEPDIKLIDEKIIENDTVEEMKFNEINVQKSKKQSSEEKQKQMQTESIKVDKKIIGEELANKLELMKQLDIESIKDAPEEQIVKLMQMMEETVNSVKRKMKMTDMTKMKSKTGTVMEFPKMQEAEQRTYLGKQMKEVTEEQFEIAASAPDRFKKKSNRNN